MEAALRQASLYLHLEAAAAMEGLTLEVPTVQAEAAVVQGHRESLALTVLEATAATQMLMVPVTAIL